MKVHTKIRGAVGSPGCDLVGKTGEKSAASTALAVAAAAAEGLWQAPVNSQCGCF